MRQTFINDFVYFIRKMMQTIFDFSEGLFFKNLNLGLVFQDIHIFKLGSPFKQNIQTNLPRPQLTYSRFYLRKFFLSYKITKN